MPKKTTDLEDMDNPDRTRYFQVIDELRGLGINEDLPLPQIVVVGNQSSGKSSLLEGMTGLSFPIASQLCTRFATQIVLKRTPDDVSSLKATIIPGPSSLDNEEQTKHLLEFGITMAVDELNDHKFAGILDEAAETMGLPTSETLDREDLDKRFSDDILRIELSGPDQHHLSVVDVPGIFHNPTKFQTLADRSLIKGLIETYMRDSRTIILALMDAINHLANQKVFTMARAADPVGARTVGVITKCDAVQPGDEQRVLKVAQNLEQPLEHGWFVVRNRSPQEIKDDVTIAQRHDNERKFFQESPWHQIPKQRAGVKALKLFLGKLLYEHIRREFPTLTKEIEALYTKTQLKLDALGSSRQTSMEQRQYLTRLANRYQHNVEDAMRGDYAADLEVRSPLKLRMHLRDLADKFEEEIRTKGWKVPFETVDGSLDKTFVENGAKNDHPNIMEWIRRQYRDARGAELPGTVNPVLIASLFRQQTEKWETIAGDYLNQVIDLITEYTKLECHRIEEDESIRGSLQSLVMSRIERAKENADQRLADILQDERGGFLQTVNHSFAEMLDTVRNKRLAARVRTLGGQDGTILQQISFSQISEALHLSNEDQAVIDIHDVLWVYYKVAIKRFGDYMVISVVERMFGEHEALKFFSAEYVSGLPDAKLAEMAAESYATSATRVELEHQCKRHLKALSVAKAVL